VREKFDGGQRVVGRDVVIRQTGGKQKEKAFGCSVGERERERERERVEICMYFPCFPLENYDKALSVFGISPSY